MFCEYCRRLFTFKQAVQHYQPVEKRRHHILQVQGANSNEYAALQIEQSPRVIGEETSKIEVYEDTKDIFTPKLLWFKTAIGKEGLKDGETHNPNGKCQICDMVFSNVSGSFVEALLKTSGKDVVGDESSLSFVYQLKSDKFVDSRVPGAFSIIPDPVLSVWLEVGEKLLPMVKLKIDARDYAPTVPGVFPSNVESTNTGSPQTLTVAAKWISHCNNAHTRCGFHLAARLPTRLIDVGTQDGRIKPHLWIPGSQAQFVPYMALSYRWGQSPAVLLTQESESSLLGEIPFALLPKSNQDAITITRFLGIRYLWIDALCIIQNLESDWRIESERMGDIYKFSYCTISASQATTGDQGCFVDRSPLQAHFRVPNSSKKISRRSLSGVTSEAAGKGMVQRHPSRVSKVQPSFSKRQRHKRQTIPSSGAEGLVPYGYDRPSVPNLDVGNISETEVERRLIELQKNVIKGIQTPNSRSFRRKIHELQIVHQKRNLQNNQRGTSGITIRTFQTDLWASEVDASPLSKRAWTLQERLLPRRILHFGKSQLFFECSASKACETWPEPVLKRRKRSPWEDDFNSNVEELHNLNSNMGLNGVWIHPLPEHWDEIVEMYTDTNLTRSEDKLVAISGLAKEIQRDTKDVYYAGLWGKDFERMLLWTLKAPQRSTLDIYRAPSWSWASVDGKIGFLAQKPSSTGDSPSVAATIHTIRTSGKDGQQSSTGQLEDGFCRISGTLRKVLRYERQAIMHRLVLSEELSDPHCYVDFFPDATLKSKDFLVDVECLPILHYRNRIPEEENIKKVTGAFLAGLVIKPTRQFRDEYRRIGVFRIAEESGKDWSRGVGAMEKEVTII